MWVARVLKRSDGKRKPLPIEAGTSVARSCSGTISKQVARASLLVAVLIQAGDSGDNSTKAGTDTFLTPF